MARTCTVCVHPDREAIEDALMSSVANRRIAAQYAVSEQAVRRHKASHISATLARATEAGEIARADDLLEQVRDLQARTLAILEAVEYTAEHKTALSAIKESRANLELLLKLSGELDERPQINVLVSAEWLELRAVIIGALEAHPQARESVLRAVEGAGDG